MGRNGRLRGTSATPEVADDRRGRWSRPLAAIAVVTGMVGATTWALRSVEAQTAPVGQGFTITPSDLAYILEQIEIAEAHVANTTAATGPCGALLGTGPHQIANPMLSFGLRTVDGSCNNLQPGQQLFGAADQVFPRLTTPQFRAADAVHPLFGPPAPTSYAQNAGMVFDAEPRLISNLIVDQTSTNPAAVAAAGYPVRSQGNDGVFPCDANGRPVPPANQCVPPYETLSIPNVTTDVGLSPPFNGLFALFGQFFDHGLDKITTGGSGTVFVPLRDDDPLVAGADHELGTSDDLAPQLRFMVLTRGTRLPGPDGVRGTSDDLRESINTDTPFVDLSQAYTSHPSHQVFIREYVNNSAGRPVSTGKLLASPDGGLPTWAMVKAQSAGLLGLRLADTDVANIPMLAVDAYGRFLPGPARGLPQYVTATGLVEGDTSHPVPVPANALRIDTAFLNDIAHSAVPTGVGPDADGVAGGSLDPTVPAGSYDDELLDLHAIAGDGRVNENIGLTAIHQVFHSEHDRLVDVIKQVLLDDSSGVTHLADWQSTLGAAGWNGERLFQAARFVTEMEYQHLVFEEFARKVQPAINPFQPFAMNQTDINPAISAEFAHAVYRFGHSMLTDSIDRIAPNGQHFDIALLDGFLDPAAYRRGPSGPLTSQQAAGAVIMGMSDQVGSEIDEFVTETLRNNLLGLPLDLASLNLTRARSEGIPSLNDVRKQIFARTNDGQLTPYANWIDFGLALKHPESLVNFIAAYGRHPNITGLDPDGPGPIVAGGLAARRIAAGQIVDGTVLPGPDGVLGDNAQTSPDESLDDIPPPTDALDFLGSTGVWANQAGTTSITGLDDVDLWIGGLAENTQLFGGLLGSTFNYVFEQQMTDLQNGDRFYYLARTPGMNLRSQLEGNSFAELMMRTTTAHSLKADPFATADCKFQLGSNPGIAGPVSGTSVTDDPNTECDENALLIRMPGNQIRYRATNSVDPPGINGQSVYNGTAATDRVYGGNDNDTFLGNAGNDVIEGGGGDDIALGGDGNDIVTDTGGADVPKGGPGNDAIDGGPGDDIIMGGDGADFTNGGANLNETFLGNGDDFAIAGQGEDAVFGDSGDDWEQGGDMPDLLIGDSSTFFFDDHNLPGNDVLIGQGGDDDYDGEGGDDVFVAGPGIEKSAGAAGWDWLIGLGDPQPQDTDLNLRILGAGQPVVEVRDRFNEVEALSGWKWNDTLRGDDLVPSATGGGGFVGCDALDQDGLDRITGLDPIVPPLTTDPTAIVSAATTRYCNLAGPVWGDGNILLGGAGSDLLEGRGADDIIDGDRYLNVRLSVRTDVTNPATEIGSTDLMEHAALTGTFGANTAGMTLQAAVFAGLVDPGRIAIVREVLANPAASDVDTAVFSDLRTNYTITKSGGITRVTHVGGTQADGSDRLTNVEVLRFSNTNVLVSSINQVPTGLPAVTSATIFREGVAVAADTSGIADDDGLVGVAYTYRWQRVNGPAATTITGATGATYTPIPADRGLRLRVIVTFTDNAGFFQSLSSTLSPVIGGVFIGTDADETISGTAGDDLIDGRGGVDTISGLGGNDTISDGTGVDTVNTGDGNDTVVNGDGNDTIATNGGTDTIHTGPGDDTINTGAGDDTIVFSPASGGNDSITGGADVDQIITSGGATVIGLRAIATVESINGGGAAIVGSALNDTLNFGATAIAGVSSIDGGDGNDTITGSAGPNTIVGGNGNDALNGGGSIDVLRGGAGADNLSGGAGADVYDYDDVGDSFGTTFDRVTGFVPGEDRLDVSTIDASTALPGDNEFTFLGGATFSGAAAPVRGEIRTVNLAAATRVLADRNDDAAIDLEIRLVGGVVAITAADLIL